MPDRPAGTSARIRSNRPQYGVATVTTDKVAGERCGFAAPVADEKRQGYSRSAQVVAAKISAELKFPTPQTEIV